MAIVSRAYLALLYLMAGLSGVILVWLMMSIIVSVAMRNMGLQPYAWLFTSAEYGLFYMTMLGAPWLVREKGHVHIELLTATLPKQTGRFVSRLVAVLCVCVSVVLAWKGADLFLTNIERGDYDVRAYYFPRWILTIAFPLSFGFMAVEFGRFVFGTDLLHSGKAGIHG